MKNVLVITVVLMFSSTLTFACEVARPQVQIQGQYQNQTQKQTVISKNVNSMIDNEAREVLPALTVNPQPFPLLNGRIGEMPTRHILWMQKCNADDTIVNVVEVNDGGLFTAVRYKDLNRKILETTRQFWGDKRHLCYWVGFNESSNGGGIGGGATGALSSGSNFMSTGASIVPGYNAATFDPKFFVEVDEVIEK